jgi:hypothetical protein
MLIVVGPLKYLWFALKNRLSFKKTTFKLSVYAGNEHVWIFNILSKMSVRMSRIEIFLSNYKVFKNLLSNLKT